MTITPNFQVSNLLLSKDEEGYFTPIDLGQLNEIYEISQDIEFTLYRCYFFPNRFRCT